MRNLFDQDKFPEFFDALAALPRIYPGNPEDDTPVVATDTASSKKELSTLKAHHVDTSEDPRTPERHAVAAGSLAPMPLAQDEEKKLEFLHTACTLDHSLITKVLTGTTHDPKSATYQNVVKIIERAGGTLEEYQSLHKRGAQQRFPYVPTPRGKKAAAATGGAGDDVSVVVKGKIVKR